MQKAVEKSAAFFYGFKRNLRWLHRLRQPYLAPKCETKGN